jgi:hypothetical protein
MPRRQTSSKLRRGGGNLDAGNIAGTLFSAYLFYAAFFGLACAWLAEQKGRKSGEWLFAGFLFGIFALLMLGFAPPMEKSSGAALPSQELGNKKCPRCAESVKLEALVCRYCKHEFDAEDIEKSVAEAKRECQPEVSYPTYSANQRFDLLLAAIKSGDAERVSLVLSQGPPGILSLDYAFVEYALDAPDTTILKMLISRIDLTKLDTIVREYSLSFKLIRNNRLDMLIFLHQNKVNIIETISYLESPLHFAERIKNDKIAEYLRSIGAVSTPSIIERFLQRLKPKLGRQPKQKQKPDVSGAELHTSPEDPGTFSCTCPNCKNILSVPLKFYGKQGKCRRCGQAFVAKS